MVQGGMAGTCGLESGPSRPFLLHLRVADLILILLIDTIPPTSLARRRYTDFPAGSTIAS